MIHVVMSERWFVYCQLTAVQKVVVDIEWIVS
jgi:hypothetical protein